MTVELRGRWMGNTISGKTHITPVEDLMRHVEEVGCWCRPKTCDGVLFIHQSFDGREQSEADKSECQVTIQ